MDTFLEKYYLPKLNQGEAESLNRPITAGEIEASKKTTPKQKLLAHKSSGPDGSTGKFYKTFQEQLTPILLRLF